MTHALLTIVLIEMIVLFIMISKYKHAKKKWIQWKNHYFAMKSVLDENINRTKG